MSKRKGVSAEEKRTRMLQLFHESQDFFQLKELEKIAPKQKGIIAQAVKDVVQGLVDDGLVESERIGTSVYYWSYPGNAEHAQKMLVEKLEQRALDTMKKIVITREEIEKEKVGREESDQRTQLLNAVSELKAKVDELKREMKKHQDNDPAIWEERNKQNVISKDAANRWTDNIFAIISWIKTKFNLDEEAINKQFGIPADMDYIE